MVPTKFLVGLGLTVLPLRAIIAPVFGALEMFPHFGNFPNIEISVG
jgi:hypothetical protein